MSHSNGTQLRWPRLRSEAGGPQTNVFITPYDKSRVATCVRLLAKVQTVDICVSVVANGFQWQGRQQQLDEKFMDFCVSPLDLHDGAKQTGKDSGPRRVCQPIPQEVQATPSANASSSAGPIGPPLVPTARQQHEQKDIKGSSGSSSSSSTDSSNICKTFFFVQPCPGLRGKSR